jgi:hypothetical protein
MEQRKWHSQAHSCHPSKVFQARQSHSREFNVKFSPYIETIFIPTTTQAITTTEDGELVIWEQKDLSNLSSLSEKGHRSAIKFMK